MGGPQPLPEGVEGVGPFALAHEHDRPAVEGRAPPSHTDAPCRARLQMPPLDLLDSVPRDPEAQRNFLERDDTREVEDIAG